MSRFFQPWFVSPNTEIIAMSVVGMCITAMEESFLNVQGHLRQVWDLPLPEPPFGLQLQYFIKTILSYIVLARSFTVHIYFMSYILLLYATFFEERPRLLLPWLLLAAIRNILIDAVATGTGVFICVWGGKMTAVCMEFLLVKMMEFGLSFYLWRSVMTLYHDIKDETSFEMETTSNEFDRKLEIAVRRRKVRSLADEVSVRKRLSVCADPNKKGVDQEDTVANEQVPSLKINTSRSLDALLTHLQYDLDMIEPLLLRRNEEVLDDQEVTMAVRAARFLRLTADDINEAIEFKGKRRAMLKEEFLGKQGTKGRVTKKGSKTKSAKKQIPSETNDVGQYQNEVDEVETKCYEITMETIEPKNVPWVSNLGVKKSLSNATFFIAEDVIDNTDYTKQADLEMKMMSFEELEIPCNDVGSISAETRTKRRVSKRYVTVRSSAVQTELVSAHVRRNCMNQASTPITTGKKEGTTAENKGIATKLENIGLNVNEKFLR